MRPRSWHALAAVAIVGVLNPPTAYAQGGWSAAVSAPLIDGLAGPLSIGVSRDGTVTVAQSFSGQLSRSDGGPVSDLVGAPGGDIGGVSLGWGGNAFYTTATEVDDGTLRGTLNRYHDGVGTVLADLGAYEEANNPDQGNTYGFEGISDDCAAQLPPDIGPATYTGAIDSHPYATATGHGEIYVAEAGANAILAVRPDTSVRTVAVLPPQPLEITAELAAGSGLPDCTVGLVYDFEPVPTDVEVGPDGMLYVTTLPGGPEDPGFPPRGGVWKVNPFTGSAHQFAFGLAGATDLAIGRYGIYVTELFAGRVSVLRAGRAVPVVSLPDPAAIEYAGGKLYVAYDVFGSGKVATIG